MIEQDITVMPMCVPVLYHGEEGGSTDTHISTTYEKYVVHMEKNL